MNRQNWLNYMKLMGKAFCFALFLFCVKAECAEDLVKLKSKVDSLFFEYKDYVDRFAADDDFAERLYSKYRRLSRKYDLLTEKKATPVLTENDVDKLVAFDYGDRKAFAQLKTPGPETDLTLAWLNYRFYEYSVAYSLFHSALKKAELLHQNLPEALFGEAMARFMMAEKEPDSQIRRDYYRESLEMLETGDSGDSPVLKERIKDLKARISIEKELISLEEDE